MNKLFQNNLFKSKCQKTMTSAAPGVLVVRLSADMTPEAIERFERAAGKALAAHPQVVIVDFAEADFVSTVMLGLLLKLRRDAAEIGVEVRLAEVQPMVRRVLNICRLDQLFSVCSSIGTAMEMDRSNSAIGV